MNKHFVVILLLLAGQSNLFIERAHSDISDSRLQRIADDATDQNTGNFLGSCDFPAITNASQFGYASLTFLAPASESRNKYLCYLGYEYDPASGEPASNGAGSMFCIDMENEQLVDVNPELLEQLAIYAENQKPKILFIALDPSTYGEFKNCLSHFLLEVIMQLDGQLSTPDLNRSNFPNIQPSTAYGQNIDATSALRQDFIRQLTEPRNKKEVQRVANAELPLSSTNQPSLLRVAKQVMKIIAKNADDVGKGAGKITQREPSLLLNLTDPIMFPGFIRVKVSCEYAFHHLGRKWQCRYMTKMGEWINGTIYSQTLREIARNSSREVAAKIRQHLADL